MMSGERWWMLPNPTYGKGGLIWAALTLALLTLPVVIVATEEALAAVPNSMREGSYACGASKWQTVWSHVLPIKPAPAATKKRSTESKKLRRWRPFKFPPAFSGIRPDWFESLCP